MCLQRTERALKDRNIAETDPSKFAAMLIEKLEQVKAKLEEPERMRELLNTVEVRGRACCEDSLLLSPGS